MPPVRRTSCLGSACVDTALPLERFVVSGGLRQVVRSGAASVRHLAGGWERAALLRPQPRAHHRRLPQRERRPTSPPRTQLPQPDSCRAASAQGDFVANWYSTNCGEAGRCVGLVQSRLKKGAAAWTTAQIQLDAPDRNQCCVSAAGQLPSRLLPLTNKRLCADRLLLRSRLRRAVPLERDVGRRFVSGHHGDAAMVDGLREPRQPCCFC